MKPGSTGGTWEISWDDEKRVGAIHRIRRVNGVAMPTQTGRIYRGEAVQRRREEVADE